MGREKNPTGSVIAPTSYLCRRVRIPNDIDLIMAVNGALLALTHTWLWEQLADTDETPAEAAELMSIMYEEYVGSNGCMIGSIFPYMTAEPPPNCLPCDGSTFDRVDFPDLYELIDEHFIVSADTFQTPDLRGLTVIGAGTGESGTPYTVDESGGEETHVLTEAELATHTHIDAGHVHSEIAASPTAIPPGEIPIPLPSATPVPSTTGAGFADIQAAGGDAPHNNMQPFRALNYCVQAR